MKIDNYCLLNISRQKTVYKYSAFANIHTKKHITLSARDKCYIPFIKWHCFFLNGIKYFVRYIIVHNFHIVYEPIGFIFTLAALLIIANICAHFQLLLVSFLQMSVLTRWSERKWEWNSNPFVLKWKAIDRFKKKCDSFNVAKQRRCFLKPKAFILSRF